MYIYILLRQGRGTRVLFMVHFWKASKISIFLWSFRDGLTSFRVMRKFQDEWFVICHLSTPEMDYWEINVTLAFHREFARDMTYKVTLQCSRKFSNHVYFFSPGNN